MVDDRPPPARAAMPAGYEFVSLLGAGGGGWVALARQTALDRPVAVKRIFGGSRNPRALARLVDEGRVLAGTPHAHIVAVYELAPIDDDLALVMEYVPGGDLARQLGSAPVDVASAQSILSDVAAALAHAHARGIAHCDVKPANVLLTTGSGAKLADFGISRLSSATAFGVEGTARYMAPEQRHAPAIVGPPADVYSFAVLACELLLDRLGDRSANVPDDLPRRLRGLLRRALVVAPERRPPITALARLIARVPTARWDALRARHSDRESDRVAAPGEREATGTVDAGTAGPATTPAGALPTGKERPSDYAGAPLLSITGRPPSAVPPPVGGLVRRSYSTATRRAAPWLVGGLLGVVIAGVIGILMVHR